MVIFVISLGFGSGCQSGLHGCSSISVKREEFPTPQDQWDSSSSSSLSPKLPYAVSASGTFLLSNPSLTKTAHLEEASVSQIPQGPQTSSQNPQCWSSGPLWSPESSHELFLQHPTPQPKDSLTPAALPASATSCLFLRGRVIGFASGGKA